MPVMSGDIVGGVETVLPANVPLLPGDFITAFRMYLASALDVGNAAKNFTMAIYASNSRPTSAAEAKTGTIVLPPTTFPLLYNTADAAAGEGQFSINLSMPATFLPSDRERYLSVVITAEASLVGAIFAAVDRRH